MKYKVLDKEYKNLFELAKDVYKNSDYFAYYLKSPEFLDILSVKDSEKAEKISKLSKQMLPDDIFVFKASYILNPFMSFRIKGWCFKTYKELGDAILAYGPDYNVTLMEIIRFQLLSKHMASSLYSKDNPELFKKVLEIEKEGESDSQFAYFSLGYLLSGEKGIIYQQVRYKDIKNLVFYLIRKENDLDALGNSLSHSALLKAYSHYHPEENLDHYFHLINALEKNEDDLYTFLSMREYKEQN